MSGVAFSVLTSGVAFIEGCPHVRGGLYRGVSSCQGWPLYLEGCPHVRGGLYRGVSSCQGWP